MNQWFLICCLVLSFQWVRAENEDKASPAKPTCAVLTFDVRNGISKDEALLLSERFANEFQKLEKYTLVNRAKMAQILEMQQFSRSELCSATDCAIEAGQLLGVQFMIYGSVGKMGSLYTVNSALVNVQNGATEKTATTDHRGAIEDLLTGAMKRNARTLVGLQPEAEAVAAWVPPPVAPRVEPAPQIPRRTKIPPEQTGLVLRYTFDQDMAQTIVDSTGNGYDGTGSGMSPAHPGKIGGGAAYLSKANGYIRLNNDEFPTLDPEDNVSFSIWWKTDTSIDWMCFLNKQDGQDESRGLFFMYYAPRSCYYIHLKGGHCADFSVPVQKGVWNHVVLVKEDTTWRVYHNGVKVQMTASSGWPFRESASQKVNLVIGLDPYGPQRYFQGYLDDFLIFNKALSDDEVLQLYNNPAGPSEPPVRIKNPEGS